MTLSDNARGILLMCGSMLAFTLNDTLVKAAISSGVNFYQVIACRGLFATAGLVALALALTGRLALWPQGSDRKFLALRTLGDVVATWTFIAALAHMPLANLSAIMQAMPILVTLAAAFLFGEKIGWRRITSIIAGFVGVMIIIRPGTADFDRWSLLGLASMACVVVRDLATRRFSAGLPSTTGAIWVAVAVMFMGSVGMAGQGWTPMPVTTWITILGASVFLVMGYLLSIMTMRVGEIGLVAPFRYTALLWAILLGWLLFGTLPDKWTLTGGAVVVASGVYMLWRERVKAREKATLDPEAPRG